MQTLGGPSSLGFVPNAQRLERRQNKAPGSGSISIKSNSNSSKRQLLQLGQWHCSAVESRQSPET